MTAFFFAKILPLTLAGSAVALILLALTPFFRKKFTSRWQYYSWSVVLVLFLFPVTALLPARTMPVSPVFPPLTAIAGGLADLAEPSMFTEPALRFFLPWREALAIVWLAGVAVSLYQKLLAAARFHQALRRASWSVTDPETLDLFGSCCAELGVRRKIELRACPPACAPMLVGILRPCIILPAFPLEPTELRLVFLHELTHYRHGDLPYKLAALLTGAVHWFNPLARLVSKQLDELCELACDETLSRRMEPEERRGYGMAILSVMGEARLAPPVSTSFSLSKQDIKRRLTLIMDYKRPTRGLIAAGICSIALLAFVGLSVSAYVLPENGKAASIPLKAAENKTADPARVLLYDKFQKSVKLENDTLSFTIPENDSGYKWAINATGTLKMGNDQMSVRFFEKESANNLWEAGKTYSTAFDTANMIGFSINASLSNNKGYVLSETDITWKPSSPNTVTEASQPELVPTSGENPFGEKIDLPVKDAQLTAGFGAYYGHAGADFSGSGIKGREIYAVADGTVVYSKSNSSMAYGNYIVLDHGNGVHTLYAQCDQLKVALRDDGEPVTVKKGDVIATVGSSGNSTGPHLHFEVRVHGTPIDPELCLK